MSDNDTRETALAIERGSSRKLIPPRWMWITFIAFGLVVGALKYWNVAESAVPNLIAYALTALGMLMLVCWGMFFSAYSPSTKLLAFCLLLVAAGGTAVQWELVGFTGAMVPKFRRRGATRPDRVLPASPGADLPTATTNILASRTDNDFPQFLGPNRNAKLEAVHLSSDWSRPPRLVWRQPIGAGWSAFSALNGYAVTLEQRGSRELVTCYEVATGLLVWSAGIEAEHYTLLGGLGPRSTPTIYGGMVYALGATGVLRCLHGTDGHTVWSHHLLTEYGVSPEEEANNVAWGRSASPLVVDELVIVPVGGPRGGRKVSLAAFRCDTGDLVWEGGDQQVSYASPSLVTLAGVPQILIVNEATVSAHDVASGQVMWQHDWDGQSNAAASVSQAVAVEGDRVFLSKGYMTGAELLEIKRSDDGRWDVDVVWKRNVMRTKLTNVVVRDGFVYGLDDGILSCIELSSGRRQWKRGRYGHGQVLLIGENLLVTAEDGEVLLIAANPQRLEILGQFAALEGKTWNNPCLFGKLLLVRNSTEAACYELP